MLVLIGTATEGALIMADYRDKNVVIIGLELADSLACGLFLARGVTR